MNAQEKYAVTGINCANDIKNECTQDCLTKAKSRKPSLDKDEVTTKVLNCHKRGQLQSLTVADLKCFLSCKKAKVGGTKEELIGRVTSILN
ncbi:hypothetical protein LUZ62_085212 [Rhynchospora pubera]|uniref:SAP domain-containing protein n=1 Tax=Rhynchospora pubera TaxID=906938 RepID=A0AAV8C8G0_9POAL|nr:hypothetical protein LUZ62_085212 [Rhynchospora pubera]